MSPSRFPFHLALVAALIAAAAAAFAQSVPPPPPLAPLPPPKLEPLPEIAPPPGVAADPELESQVTITRKEGETVEQARVNGRLVWLKVTPRHGRPYFLVPDSGGNAFVRRESFDTGLAVPLWSLFEF